MAPSNDQPSRPPLPVRLLLIVAARNPLDLEQVREPRPPFVRYALLWLGVLVCSLLTIPVASAMSSDFGMNSPTVLLAVNPLWSMIALLVLVVLYAVIAFMLACELNPAVALFVIGWGFGVLSLTTGGIADFAWADGSLWQLGIETILWSLVIGALVWCLMRFTGGLPEVPHDWRTERIGSVASLLSKPSLLAFAAGAIALPLSWLLLVETLNAQALGAIILASFFAGMAGRVAAPRLDPILIYFSVIFLGGLAQIIVASGWSGSLADALVTHELPRFSFVMPFDWVGGSLMGVSMGIGWARSFIVQDADQD